MPDHTHFLPTGHMLAEYRIEQVLGSGGFGITYCAWDTNLDKRVAIKEYLPNELAVRADATTVHPKSSGDRAGYQWGLERFLDEARTLAQFRHHHINEVYRFFDGNGTAYMVLEYIDGETLESVLQRDGRLAPKRLRRLLDELLSGLDEVHRADYVHRDIKPSNIMLRTDGSAVLVDFGAARQAIGQRFSKKITMIRTPGYAPIEQYIQKAALTGPWTDLYALGMTAYRCLSGISESELPDAPARLLLNSLGEEDLRPAVEVGSGAYGRALLSAVDYAIHVEMRDRPQTVSAMREVLAGGAAGKTATDEKAKAAAESKARPAAAAKTKAAKAKAQRERLVRILGRDLSSRAKDPNGWTDLHYAVAADLHDVARRLIAAGADVNARLKDDKDEVSPSLKRNLHELLGNEVFKKLRKLGTTPLHIAAVTNANKTAALLLKNSADVAAKNTDGKTALHYAAWGNADKTAALLLKNGADVAAENTDDLTPLHVAAWGNADKTAVLLLKNGADVAAKNADGLAPLHYAARENADKTAALLLKNGADVAAKNADGLMPLHYAARENADKTAALLLKNGADVAAKTNNGRTPLHSAAWGNADKTAALLLKNGADVAAKSADGRTPLHDAAYRNADKTAALLLKNGADSAAKNKHGSTPLHDAAWGNADKTAALLLKSGADVDAKNRNGETPLHKAAHGNADKTAALLLKSGASPYAQSHAGETPLDVAMRENSDKVIHILQN